MYRSTTVLGPSASLKDPRLWSEGPSISACATNGSLCSGCSRTSHRLVEIPARCVTGFRSAPASVTNHHRSPFLERAQGRCLRPITTSTGTSPLLPALLYAPVSHGLGSRPHVDTFRRYFSQERRPLFPSSMLTIQLAHGRSLRKTYLPVRRQHQATRSPASCPPASLICSVA